MTAAAAVVREMAVARRVAVVAKRAVAKPAVAKPAVATAAEMVAVASVRAATQRRSEGVTMCWQVALVSHQ